MRCSACSTHKSLFIRGFPELQGNLDELEQKAQALFDESAFQQDGIYFSIFKRVLPLLKDRQAAMDLPPTTSQWLDEQGEAVIRRFISLKAMGRFVDYFERQAFPYRCANQITFKASQGTICPISWRGLPMMRTIWDFALAPLMVQEIRPRTIIELGSASGGAAAYYADIQRIHGIPPNIVTMDIIPAAIDIEGVTFIKGDSTKLSTSLPSEFLKMQAHPWIVIEDTHQDIGNFLEYVHSFLRAGDYLIIEDVLADKYLFPFLSDHSAEYKVDTLFTDYFGHNNTCAPDQILRRMT